MNCPHCHQPIMVVAAVGTTAIASPDECAVHRTRWTYKPGGVSQKTGKSYQGFWKCDGKNPDGSYCAARPDATWAKSHQAPDEW